MGGEAMKHITKALDSAVDNALKDDDKLTPKDLERKEIDRAIKNIKAIWNPDSKQTPDSLKKRNDCLYAILTIAADNNLDHQKIADWIYGKGKVEIEVESKVEPESLLHSVLVFNLLSKRGVRIRATPSVHAWGKVHTNKDGTLTLETGQVFPDDEGGMTIAEETPKVVTTIYEASRLLRKMVQRLRKDEKEN